MVNGIEGPINAFTLTKVEGTGMQDYPPKGVFFDHRSAGNIKEELLFEIDLWKHLKDLDNSWPGPTF
jgi:hypothetical protein